MNEREPKPSVMVFLTILMLLITFISCDNKLNVSNTNEVRFTTEIGRKAMANSEWQANDKVGIYMVVHDALTASAASERANKLYTADTSFQTSGFSPADNANTLKWDDISNPAITHFDFIAYYPYVSPIANTTALPINVYPGSGEQDTGKADFLWGRTDNVQNNTSTVHLKLDHMLSRLIVNISPSTTIDADAITGGVLSVMVEGTSTQGTFNLDTGALSVTSSVEGIKMKDISHTLSQADQDAGKRRFEAVLIPVVHSEILLDTLKLEFTLGSDTYTWAATSIAEGDKHLIHFDKGKTHVYNMTLNTDAHEVSVAAIQIEIQDWDTGDGGNWGATPKLYRLSFSRNGAMVGDEPEDLYAHAGDTVTLPDSGTLEKTGYYYFGGWDTTSNGNGVQYAIGDTLEILDQDVTLYARWLVKIKSVSAGDTHTMILKEDGTLWATGQNNYGQLGVGDTIDRSTPVQIMTGVKEIAAGSTHTMILKEDGTLWATGRNTYGQLGVGATPTQTSAPVQIMTGVKEISAGSTHTMILKENGTLWATGRNNYGQLGVGDTTNRSTPVQVWDSANGSVFMTGVKAVSAGASHTMILKENGTLWATGRNFYYQLADGTKIDKNIPVQVISMGSDVEAVSAGTYHTMILKKNRELWAVGNNQSGQLGDNTQTTRSSPVQVKASTILNDFMIDVEAVSIWDYHTIILKKNGTLWATGNNSSGQLGIGATPAQISIPMQVKGADGVGFMTDVASVSTGTSHTMIVGTDGTLWATGLNNKGQLGDGTTTTRTTPVQIIF
ncbi:fimbrillin family protein [Parasphaerochaeta coccoides]|uniref:Regulator of chromosome condensation RCC1 n=1 Tax=Parasphaerochaeta coccoides (strain ATCC BAA-1237 / DSM 17374 / SPN1) TaxID=760011 RepID=F4GLD6_PARC1|nr:fimbrillin family protein [Parasphaerochaeta coccoides]AEC02968.1 regulator of chromosome condensation RCC1 [Parasphaerochaeta coccoides DSM 17374]